jgi:hypothetical protein
MKGFIFLASPYSHPLGEVRHARFAAAERALFSYFEKGSAIYSPIVQWHNIAVQRQLPVSFEAWTALNDPLILSCRSLHILELDGWLTSVGVQHEIEVALAADKPCYVVSPFRDYSVRRLKDALA